MLQYKQIKIDRYIVNTQLDIYRYMNKQKETEKPMYHVLFGDFMKEKNTTILKTWYSIDR